MTEAEVKTWLGLGDVPRSLRPEIIEGMADVTVPASDAGQLDVFRAFLACAGKPTDSIWAPS